MALPGRPSSGARGVPGSGERRLAAAVQVPVLAVPAPSEPPPPEPSGPSWAEVIVYPYYDPEPVSESDIHRMAAAYLDQSLRRHFRSQPDVYVSANMFVYYQKGDREERVVSPDVFVCFGASKKLRKRYLTWREGTAPQVVFKITSDSSRLSDQGDKRAKYTEMGVEEYYLFDPFGEWIPGKFRAYRREGDELVPVVAGQRCHSPRLGLDLVVEDTLLRLVEPKSGRRLPTPEELEATVREAEARAGDAEARAEEERTRRVALEEELRRLREECG